MVILFPLGWIKSFYLLTHHSFVSCVYNGTVMRFLNTTTNVLGHHENKCVMTLGEYELLNCCLIYYVIFVRNVYIKFIIIIKMLKEI